MTRGNAFATVIAFTDRVGVMAGGTVEVAALQENDEPIAGSVDNRVREDLTDGGPRRAHFPLLAACGRVSR